MAIADRTMLILQKKKFKGRNLMKKKRFKFITFILILSFFCTSSGSAEESGAIET